MLSVGKLPSTCPWYLLYKIYYNIIRNYVQLYHCHLNSTLIKVICVSTNDAQVEHYIKQNHPV